MSTSKLQRYVSRKLEVYLSEFSIIENARPSWMDGLELDFYIPKILVAIEVQGRQHIMFNSFFHSSHKDYKDQLQRDARKKDLCFLNGITLYEVYTEKDADILLLDLYQSFCKKIHVEETVLRSDSEDFQYRMMLDRARFEVSRVLSGDKKYKTSVNKKIDKLLAYCERNGIPMDDKELMAYRKMTN